MKKKILAVSASLALLLNGSSMSLFAMEEMESMADNAFSEKMPEALETEQEAAPVIVKTGMLGTARWTIDSNGTLTFSAGEYDSPGPNMEKIPYDEYSEDFRWLNDYDGEIKKVDGSAHLKISGDITNMFTGSIGMHNIDTPLRSVEVIDLSGWDTSGVTCLQSLFYDCVNLRELNLSSWDVRAVEDYNDMFENCDSLKKVDISGNFNLPIIYGNFYYLDFFGFTHAENIEEVRFSNDSYRIAKELVKPQNNAKWYIEDEGPFAWSALPSQYSSALTSIDHKTATLMREDAYLKNKQPISIEQAEYNKIDSIYLYEGKPIEPKPRIVVNGKTLVNGSDYTLSYVNNDKPGLAKVIVTGIGNYTGSLSIPFTIKEKEDSTQKPDAQEVKSVNMHRLYNPNSGEHFYTADTNEKNHLVSVGWKYEGTGWVAPSSSKTPVYRLYNKNAGDHHYTLDANEKNHLVSVGWTFEGTGWYSDDAKTVPLYRQYNPNAKAGSHNYTTSKDENDYLVKIGWKGEGIGWYALEAGKPADSSQTPAQSAELKQLAGTYNSSFNGDVHYKLTVKEDGSYTLESEEYHVSDDFTKRCGSGVSSAYARQTSTGKIELVKKTDTNHMTFKIVSMNGQYPLYQECPNGQRYYFYGNPEFLTAGKQLKFYSAKASDAPAGSVYKGKAQIDFGFSGLYLVRQE